MLLLLLLFLLLISQFETNDDGVDVVRLKEPFRAEAWVRGGFGVSGGNRRGTSALL